MKEFGKKNSKTKNYSKKKFKKADVVQKNKYFKIKRGYIKGYKVNFHTNKKNVKFQIFGNAMIVTKEMRETRA